MTKTPPALDRHFDRQVTTTICGLGFSSSGAIINRKARPYQDASKNLGQRVSSASPTNDSSVVLFPSREAIQPLVRKTRPTGF